MEIHLKTVPMGCTRHFGYHYVDAGKRQGRQQWTTHIFSGTCPRDSTIYGKWGTYDGDPTCMPPRATGVAQDTDG